jgi:hypothetical protein
MSQKWYKDTAAMQQFAAFARLLVAIGEASQS